MKENKKYTGKTVIQLINKIAMNLMEIIGKNQSKRLRSIGKLIFSVRLRFLSGEFSANREFDKRTKIVSQGSCRKNAF